MKQLLLSLRVLSIGVGLIALTSCGAFGSKSGSANSEGEGRNLASEIESSDSTVVYLDWGGTSGAATSPLEGVGTLDNGGAQVVHMGEMGRHGADKFQEDTSNYRKFCFDNQIQSSTGRRCATSSAAVANSIPAYTPAAIQGFQLNFSKFQNLSGSAYQNVNFKGALVWVSEMRFDHFTGELKLKPAPEPICFDGGSGACSSGARSACAQSHTISRPNGSGLGTWETVVNHEPTPGQEGVMTGLFLYDEYRNNVNNQYHNDVQITAAKVWSSGMIPWEDGVALFRFGWVPSDRIDTTSFGAKDFSSSSNNDVLVSPYLGARPEHGLPGNWYDYVVSGFCIQGTKLRADGVTVPLMWGARARIHRPTLRQ